MNPDPGLSMFHVMPPSGTVIPGSMPFELAGSASIRAALAASEEGDLVTVPAIAAAVALPEGHLSVPNPPIDPFTTTIEEFSRLGFQPVLQLDSLPA